MTDKQQLRILAEYVGFKHVILEAQEWWEKDGQSFAEDDLPQFLVNHSTMLFALQYDQSVDFVNRLNNIITEVAKDEGLYVWELSLRQLARCLIQTLGKWITT